MLEFKNRLLLLQILFRTRFCTFYWICSDKEHLALWGPNSGEQCGDCHLIFGIWITVLIWTFSLVSELPYTGLFLFSQNQPSFFHPFTRLESIVADFFFQNALIWSNQNICWLQDKSVNNCTLYLNYQAVCLLLDILTGKRGSHDYHAISFSYENHAKIRWKVSHVNVFAWYSHENCTIVSHFCLFS